MAPFNGISKSLLGFGSPFKRFSRPSFGAIADFFVSPSGSNDNDGTIDSPFMTIQRAVDAAISAGGRRTILVRGGVYRETVSLAGWGGSGGAARQQLMSYPGETPVISGSEIITGWVRCNAIDADIIGPTLGVNNSPVWKVTIQRSAIQSSALGGANLRENGVQVALVSDRASIGFSPLVQSDNRDFHIPDSFTTNGEGDVDTITSTIFGGYSEAQLQRCVLVGYGSPNVVFHSAITNASGNTITLAAPYPPQGGTETSFNLVNALPALVAGRWGYVDHGNGEVTLYLYPNSEDNITDGIEIGARAIGIDVRSAPWVTIDGFVIEGQGGGTVTQSSGIISNSAINFNGLTIQNCVIRRTMNFTSQGGYGAIYLRQASQTVIDGCNFQDVYGQYGIGISASSGVSGGNRISNCEALRVEKSPWRLYGQNTTLLAYCNATDCALSAHANKANTYEQNRRVTFWGLKFSSVDTEYFPGYVTWQEASTFTLGMSLIPTGADGRSVTNQQNGTEPPDNASTHYIVNVCAPVSAAATPSYGSIVATGSISPAADETTRVYNSVASGISLGSSGIFEGSHNVFIDSLGNVSPGAFDLTFTPDEVFVDPAEEDFALAAESKLIGAGGKDLEDWLLELEAQHGGFDLHRDVNKTPFSRLDFIGCYAGARVVDVIPPSLTSITASPTSSTDINLTFTTDTNVGGVRWVVTSTNVAPSAAQITEGLDHLGNLALFSGAFAVRQYNVVMPISGLTPGTSYFIHFIHEDGHENVSTVYTVQAVTDQAPDTFTTTGTGPWFADSNTLPANTTRIEYEARMKLASNWPNGTIALVGSLSGTNCDFRPVGTTGAPRWTVSVRDNTNTVLVSTTGNGATGINLPVGEWFSASLDVDLVAGTASLQQSDGQSWQTSFISADPRFTSARSLGLLGGNTGGNLVPQGVEVEYLRIWLTTNGVRTLHVEVAGDAATVNAHPWARGTPASSPPSIVTAPVISGLLAQGSDLTLDIGTWEDATSFEIEVAQTNPTATLLSRQSVAGDTTGILETVVGSSITLRVWATGPGGTTLVESASFGPIEAPGDQWIRGIVISPTEDHNPTPVDSPVSWSLAAPYIADELYSVERGWGFVGGSVSTDTTTFSSMSKTDPRLRGRLIMNASPGSRGIRIDVPEPGVYLVYAGLGASSTATPRLAIRDGGYNGTLLHQVNEDLAISVLGSQTMDITGTVRTSEEWAQASAYGGDPVEVTVTSDHLWVGRPDTNGSTQLNCVAVLKKAA